MQNKYNSPEFKSLQKKWYDLLKELGFKDIEDSNENLKTPDRRTIAWKNRARICEFFLKLDTYLNVNEFIPKKDRQVLELWSQGLKLVEIAKKCKKSISFVEKIIYKYKQLVLNYYDIDLD